MNSKSQRIAAIIGYLKTNSTCRIEDLADVFGVSTMTIRRDLDGLKKNNLVNVRTGTIFYNHSANTTNIPLLNYTLTEASPRMENEKDRIGAFAATLIKPNDTVIIDGGTTTLRLAQNLPADIPFQALTYGVNILMELLRFQNVKVMFAGGFYHSEVQVFESAEGAAFIDSLRSHKFFLSAAGINEDLGITCYNNYEVPMKAKALKNSNEIILLADSSKFNLVNIAYICSIDDIDTVITDEKLEEKWVRLLTDKGKNLYLV